MKKASRKSKYQTLSTALGVTGVLFLAGLCQYIDPSAGCKIRFIADDMMKFPDVITVAELSDGTIYVRTKWHGSFHIANGGLIQYPTYGGNC
jgi:hypothetical protein